MTGILPIKKYRGQSTLNNFNEFTMISFLGWPNILVLLKARLRNCVKNILKK